MKYEYKLTIRILLALILIYPLFNIIITPVSKYIVYYTSKIFFNINLINNIFNLNGHNLIFVTACAAVSAYYLIFLLTIFTKGLTLKKSIKIFLTGAILILIMNILRIELMLYILNYHSIDLFNKMHLLFWKAPK